MLITSAGLATSTRNEHTQRAHATTQAAIQSTTPLLPALTEIVTQYTGLYCCFAAQEKAKEWPYPEEWPVWNRQAYSSAALVYTDTTTMRLRYLLGKPSLAKPTAEQASPQHVNLHLHRLELALTLTSSAWVYDGVCDWALRGVDSSGLRHVIMRVINPGVTNVCVVPTQLLSAFLDTLAQTHASSLESLTLAVVDATDLHILSSYLQKPCTILTLYLTIRLTQPPLDLLDMLRQCRPYLCDLVVVAADRCFTYTHVPGTCLCAVLEGLATDFISFISHHPCADAQLRRLVLSGGPAGHAYKPRSLGDSLTIYKGLRELSLSLDNATIEWLKIDNAHHADGEVVWHGGAVERLRLIVCGQGLHGEHVYYTNRVLQVVLGKNGAAWPRLYELELKGLPSGFVVSTDWICGKALRILLAPACTVLIGAQFAQSAHRLHARTYRTTLDVDIQQCKLESLLVTSLKQDTKSGSWVSELQEPQCPLPTGLRWLVANDGCIKAGVGLAQLCHLQVCDMKFDLTALTEMPALQSLDMSNVETTRSTQTRTMTLSSLCWVRIRNYWIYPNESEPIDMVLHTLATAKPVPGLHVLAMDCRRSSYHVNPKSIQSSLTSLLATKTLRVLLLPSVHTHVVSDFLPDSGVDGIRCLGVTRADVENNLSLEIDIPAHTGTSAIIDELVWPGHEQQWAPSPPWPGEQQQHGHKRSD